MLAETLICIRRGAHEIGGSCVEVGCGDSRLVLDLGIPLKPPGDTTSDVATQQRDVKGLLPQVDGLYAWDDFQPRVDGLLISHAHQDHYGFVEFVHPEVPVYVTRATLELIRITEIFSGKNFGSRDYRIVTAGIPFDVGPFHVTAYMNNHSALGGVAFVVEVEGKTFIYSGDLRQHGRNGEKVLQYLLDHAPKSSDALLLEGTMLSRDHEEVLTEDQLEERAVEIISKSEGPVLVCQSGQNIDRLVSFFRASRRTGRLFLIDVYVACVLEALNSIPRVNLPHPSPSYSDIRVFFSVGMNKQLMDVGRGNLVYRYRPFKMNKDMIMANASKIVLVARTGLLHDLRRIQRSTGAFTNGTFIYSQWEGYCSEPKMQRLLTFAKKAGMGIETLHTSGHATAETLKRIVDALQPRNLIPIHTEHPDAYLALSKNAIHLEDNKFFTL